MSAFTAAEIAYLRSQFLGRLATAGRNGQPHVVPVTFRYNETLGAIEIRGRARTLQTGGQEIMARFSPEMVRITPRRIVSWGIEGEGFTANARSVR